MEPMQYVVHAGGQIDGSIAVSGVRRKFSWGLVQGHMVVSWCALFVT